MGRKIATTTGLVRLLRIGDLLFVGYDGVVTCGVGSNWLMGLRPVVSLNSGITVNATEVE